MAVIDLAAAKEGPTYDPTSAAGMQNMLREFFEGVRLYVDERLDEKLAERAQRLDLEELESRFNAHAVNEQGMADINESRVMVFGLATFWLDLLPAGRDKSLAYTALEEASFHATAAISRQKGNQS